MNIDEQYHLAKDCDAAHIWTSTAMPPMLRQLWGVGLRVPFLFMWRPWVLILSSILYFDLGFAALWFIGKFMVPFLQQPTAQVLPVFCVAFGIGGIFNAFHQFRIRRKIGEVDPQYK